MYPPILIMHFMQVYAARVMAGSGLRALGFGLAQPSVAMEHLFSILVSPPADILLAIFRNERAAGPL